MATSVKWPSPTSYASLTEWAVDLVRVLQNNLSTLPDTSAQVGLVAIFPGTVLPSGWLKTDGSTYSMAAYPALFQFLGSGILPTNSAPAGFISGIKAQ